MAIGDLMKREYGNFRGIDLLNPANSVDLTRSPDCKNVWKSYNTIESNIIQTRPGYTKRGNVGSEKVYKMYVYSKDTALIHIGNKLIKWVGFPSEVISIETLSEKMNTTKKAVFFYYNEYVYILDGINYFRFDGTNLINVVDIAYIPTTTISRAPSGGGDNLEDVNLLQPKRKNEFVGDGTSKDYYLDATDIDDVVSVIVDDVVTTSYTVDKVLGKVTFETAPSKPTGVKQGVSNVKIEFSKTITDYAERILNCSIAIAFDNRVFFSGNPDFANAVFHCSLNNPAYISDLDYYECGSQRNPIKSLVVGNNLLWVLKAENENKDTLFYLDKSTDAEYGRIYPTNQGNVSVGCYVTAVNFQDRIVFLSRAGLEGIDGNIQYEQSITHKSSLVDSRLINMSNYEFASMTEYKGYLFIAIDNKVFIADSRQQFKGHNGSEYEWYYWELPVNISTLCKYEDELYFADDHGNIYSFGGTNDDGIAIESYWTTPRDAWGYINHLKKTNKRGAILKVKNIPNGKVKLSVETNKKPEERIILEASSSGFDFENLDFENLSFETGENSYIVYRIKEKKFIDISLKVFSDELDKPFGLINITLEAFLGGYVKR